MKKFTRASPEDTYQTLLPPAGEIQNLTPFDGQSIAPVFGHLNGCGGKSKSMKGTSGVMRQPLDLDCDGQLVS